MSVNEVTEGYSISNRNKINLVEGIANSAQADATQAINDASAADSKADTADSKAETADSKAESAQSSADEAFDSSKTSRDRDMEALLQELVINIDAPDGEFLLGSDDGYFQYVTEGDANEYREIEYPEGEDLDDSGAGMNATSFELVKRDGDDQHYIMIEDDDGLYIVNHSDGSREAVDDVFEGTGNDKSDIASKDLEGGKNPMHYIMKLTYAPAKQEHVRDAKNLRSVHLRALDGQGQPKLWLYKQGENDRLESSAMSNVEKRRLYLLESGQAE